MRVWRHTRGMIGFGVLALTLGVATAQAQQQTPSGGQNQQPNQGTAPIPAYHSPLGAGSDNQNEVNSQNVVPDKRPLAGAQYLSLGNLEGRSYWQPRFDLYGTADSNPNEGPTNPSWSTWTSFLGGVDIHHLSGRSDLMASYTGGIMHSTDGSAPIGTVQRLGAAERFSLRRSEISLLDQLSYLPQASFGIGGIGVLSSSGIGSVGLGPGFTVGQSILTGQGQSLANSSVAQIAVNLTPRSSLTFAGGYSLLHYFDQSLLDSRTVTALGGYNYLLTRNDTIAFLYGFSAFRYNNFNQSADSHSAEVSYARRVTGRLAFQIAAGPEVSWFQVPISGGSGSTVGSGAGAGNSQTTVSWTLNTALQYQLERTALRLTYWHGTSAGSGVLAGSTSDEVSGSVTRQMSRTFSSGLVAGYSRNSGLSDTTSQPSYQSYNYWFAGVSLAHPFSATTALTFSYQVQYQDSNHSFCIGPTCGTSVVRHLISIGFGWHERPLLF